MNTQSSFKPYVIGLDLGGTNSVFGIVDSRGEIKATTAIKTGGYEKVEDYVAASVEALQVIIEQVDRYAQDPVPPFLSGQVFSQSAPRSGAPRPRF